MIKPKTFRSQAGDIPLPFFFPDATRAVIKTLDTVDIKNTKTPGILVNTYHLYLELGKQILKEYQGIRPFMRWDGALISDSGGFQVMSLAKINKKGAVTDKGVSFSQSKKKRILLTPEKSIQFQMLLRPDMLVVLDDFTMPKASYQQAKETVDRTVLWAKRSKNEFIKLCDQQQIKPNQRPYLLAVVQGGDYLDLRRQCAQRLLEIGFDGYGYGGWPLTDEGKFNYQVAECLADSIPSQYFLYGLGIGKPDEIVRLVKMGFDIFDCVLPTRDARHKRLYVYTAETIDQIDVHQPNFFKYFSPHKQKYYRDQKPVSQACDCHLCRHYTRAYLAHLFRINDSTASRLATIHNLRFYSILMEKLRDRSSKEEK